MTPVTETAPRPLTEAEFQKQVTDLAELLGWSWAHFRPAQTSKGWRVPVSGPLGKGWPDLVLVRVRDDSRGGRRLIFAELKSEAGKVSPEQTEVMELLDWLQSPAPEDAFWVSSSGKHPHIGLFPRVEVKVWRPSDFDTIAAALR